MDINLNDKSQVEISLPDNTPIDGLALSCKVISDILRQRGWFELLLSAAFENGKYVVDLSAITEEQAERLIQNLALIDFSLEREGQVLARDNRVLLCDWINGKPKFMLTYNLK